MSEGEGDSSPRNSRSHAPSKDIVAGSFRGIAQVIVGHPLDTVKVRLQTQSAIAKQFDGPLVCVVQTIRTEGLLALYKGAASPIYGCALYSSVLFFAYGSFKSLFQPVRVDGSVDVVRNLAAASMTGLAAAFVEGPIDLLKSKLQVQTATGQMVRGETQFRSTYDVAKYVYKTNGVSGIFQGLGPTVMRNFIGSAAYFTSYELLSQAFRCGSSSSDSAGKVLLAGGLSGMIFWTSIFPLDVIKTRMQTDTIIKEARKYRSVWHCGVEIARKEGPRALWQGYSTQMVRSFPTNAASFLAFEAVRSRIDSAW